MPRPGSTLPRPSRAATKGRRGAKRTLGLALRPQATPPARSLSPGPSNTPQTARISALKRAPLESQSVGSSPLLRVPAVNAGIGGPEGGSPIPVIAHMICHTCGLQSEAAAASHGPSATRCPCGGIRQVVRIVRHSPHAASASSEALERSVQERADDETRNPLNAARADRGARRPG
jgi:hypothetical protein